MGDGDDGEAAGKAGDVVADRELGFGIKRTRHLIEDQKLRIDDKCTGE